MDQQATENTNIKYDLICHSGGGDPFIKKTPPIDPKPEEACHVQLSTNVFYDRWANLNTKGLTLIEILFSILLLGIMVFSLTGAYMSVHNSPGIEDPRLPLDDRMRDRMEEIISRSFDAIVDGSDVVTIRGKSHTISWTVIRPDLDEDSRPDSIAKEITVTSGGESITILLIDSRRLTSKI